MTLRELTHHKHIEAEQHEFSKILLSGEISKALYANFLFNNLICYAALENKIQHILVDKNLQGIERTNKMAFDLSQLSDNIVFGLLPSTQQYCEYINNLSDDKKLIAHMYVRHMGDMYGVQILKNLVPSVGTMYEFTNRSESVKIIRENLTDDMAPEAIIVFNFVISLFDELMIFHKEIEKQIEEMTI
jgi:heme oxygenase